MLPTTSTVEANPLGGWMPIPILPLALPAPRCPECRGSDLGQNHEGPAIVRFCPDCGWIEELH